MRTLNLNKLLITSLLGTLPAWAGGGRAPTPTEPDPPPASFKIAVVGDAVAVTAEDGSAFGWGDVLQRHFGGYVGYPESAPEIVNWARADLNAAEFYDEGLWSEVLSSGAPYVYIAFGAFETDKPEKFARTLNTYVQEALARGITPILVTPAHPLSFNRTGGVTYIRQEYADAVKSVGRSQRTAIIDMYRTTARHWNNRGVALTGPLFAAGSDRLMSESGALFLADVVADETRTAVPALGGVIREPSPDFPEQPEEPDNPDNPDEPGNPDLPDLPELPENPDLPELPDDPNLPDLPELPDDPRAERFNQVFATP